LTLIFQFHSFITSLYFRKRSQESSFEEQEIIEHDPIIDEIEEFTPSKRKKRNSISSMVDTPSQSTPTKKSSQTSSTPKSTKRKSTGRSSTKKQKTDESPNNEKSGDIDTNELYGLLPTNPLSAFLTLIFIIQNL